MYFKSKSGHRVHLTGPAENAAINAGIAADPERERAEEEVSCVAPDVELLHHDTDGAS